MNGGLLLAAGGIVVAGRMIQGKPQTARVIVGIFFLAIFVSLIGEANEKLARQYALLLFIVAALGYGPTIFAAIGYPVVTTGENAASAARWRPGQ